VKQQLQERWTRFNDWMQRTPVRRKVAYIAFLLYTFFAVPLGHTPEVKRG
jgi:hypothetical protein